MRKIPYLFFFTVSAFVFSSLAAAQIAVGITDEDRAEFARHRAALLERIGDGVAVVFGSHPRGDHLRFRQRNRFYYLTGVEIASAALILDGKREKAILFLPPAREGRSAIYNGPSLGPGPEAAAEYGIEEVRSVSELEKALKEIAAQSNQVWALLSKEEAVASGTSADRRRSRFPWSAGKPDEILAGEWLEKILPDASVKDVSPEIDDLRRVKTPWEIERMTEACRIAGLGHVAAMRATCPGTFEYEIEAAAMKEFIANGAFYPAYNAIVGAGPNNNILHYSLSADVADDGELVLVDFGPDYRYYASDVTRTWPVSGKFTPRQRKVYMDCLEIQRRLIEFIKPGVTLPEIFKLCQELSFEMGYEKNHLHGPSHYIGMAVHDAGLGSKPLEPGVVISVEPGLYFLDEGWGIRIEDDVLVTEKGCRVLTDMVPKHPDEIEAIMSAGKNE